jgi:hypothetical protein
LDSVSIYDSDPADLTSQLCAYTGSTITAAQWAEYAPGIPYQDPCLATGGSS